MSYLQAELSHNIDDAEAASPTMCFLNFISDKTKSRSQKQPRRDEPRRPNNPPKLTTADLRDDAKVLEWYAATKTTRVSLYDAELFNVFAAAECALSHGDNPPALFSWIVRGRHWDMLTNSQDDPARQRVLRLRNPEREAKLRRMRELGEDFAPAFSKPESAGDIVNELIQKLFSPSKLN